MGKHYFFIGGPQGPWTVTGMSAYRGARLAAVERIDIVNSEAKPTAAGAAWTLAGFTSNVRYPTGAETKELKARQQGLGRSEATSAVLIPIRKSAEWWDLAEDERRAIFEETSHHTAIGMDYLPAIARQLVSFRRASGATPSVQGVQLR